LFYYLPGDETLAGRELEGIRLAEEGQRRLLFLQLINP
jgi:hypothetical protein